MKPTWLPATVAAFALLWPVPATTAGSVPTPESRHLRYVLGVSPFLDDSAKDEVFRHIVRLLLEDMPLNSSLWLYDAYHLRTIAQINIPDARAFRSDKTRANQFQQPLHQTKRFLAAKHSRPSVEGLDFNQAIRLPQFLDFVADNLTGPDHDLVVILLGSPLHQDEKEPSFSMVDGYFPSDGHLTAMRERSVYGRRDQGRTPGDIAVHLGWFGDPWASELHQEKIARFWALFLQQQGARLATFTGDLPTVFNAVRSGAEPPDAAGRRHAPDPAQDKIEMLRLTRDVGVDDWITRDLPAHHRQPPPSVTVGPMKIGIRWQGDLDLDLYARPAAGGETLYFEHTRSPAGYYFKDHRSSPDREYEFIEFLSPVDVRQVEASVNFYEGASPGGPEGEVRIEFDGRIYAGRFSLAGARGNRGRGGDGQDRFWTSLDIPKLLKLR